MNLSLETSSVVPVLTSVGFLLVFSVPGFLFYGYLADRAEFSGRGRVGRDQFGPWDALAGFLLATLFAVLTVIWILGGAGAGESAPNTLPATGLVVLSALQTEVIFLTFLLGIALVLRLGGFTWWRSLGLQPQPIPTVVWRAVWLLALAYPLIVIALQLGQVLLAACGYIDDSKQDAVRFLVESKSFFAKIIVAGQAILCAPAQEELIFRGYIYGVARRYLGVGSGVLISATLFAGIHQHLPSFGGLFALAVCLALAYEWTRSILVPMAMHALFNLLSVVVLFQ